MTSAVTIRDCFADRRDADVVNQASRGIEHASGVARKEDVPFDGLLSRRNRCLTNGGLFFERSDRPLTRWAAPHRQRDS